MNFLVLIGSFSLLFVLIGWTYSALPKPHALLQPHWTRSFELYLKPHAIWLDQYKKVGANQKKLVYTLKMAAQKKQTPELVLYCIPMRDLGQSSEGGFDTYSHYRQENEQLADTIQAFTRQTGIHPILYLEPDGLSLAVQYLEDTQQSAKAQKIYEERTRVIRQLVLRYQQAGAMVYLDAAHSGWFDYSEQSIERMASALNEAGISQANGIASNISNRQKVLTTPLVAHTELHYLKRLLPRLGNTHLDVRVDTSRNGGLTHARQYYLSKDGLLIDNEVPEGRLVGHWRYQSKNDQSDILLKPFFGKTKAMSRLLKKEKYQFNKKKRLLMAPAWLDAVGDVQLGPEPTDAPPEEVKSTIQHYRYIKPPDDCDGSLNCPPGKSKSIIVANTQRKQHKKNWHLPDDLWER